MNASSNDLHTETALRATVEALTLRSLGARIRAFEAIPSGLGTRLFFRLRLEGGHSATAVARIDAPEDPAARPPGIPPEPALEPLRSFLEARGIPVPRSYARDPEHGIELLEDLGSSSLEHLSSRISAPQRLLLYAEACAIAVKLQTLEASPDEISAFGRRLDAPLFRYKAEQVVQWALPWALARATRPSEAAVVRDAFALIADESQSAPQRLSHRDYKAANLYVREEAAPGSRIVLIDLQGALMAPPEYDFVCLLRDAHVSLPDAEVATHLEAIRPALPDALSNETLERRFCLLTLSRVGKDLSRYLYAAHERGDLRYLPLLPEASRTLRAAAAQAAAWDPKLARLAELFAKLPADWSGAQGPRPGDDSCVR